MKRSILIRVLVTVLLTVAGVPGAIAQNDASQPDGWQGPRPTPQKNTPPPALQHPAPSGKQVLEIPSRPQQQSVEPPHQQAVIPPRPQSESPPHFQADTVRPSHLLTVTVTDPSGRYVPGLRREDFVVYEDGVPQDITYFNTGQSEPVSLGLIVDTSGSMRSKID